MTPPVSLQPHDRDLAHAAFDGFLPDEIFDFHVHIRAAEHFAPGTFPGVEKGSPQDCAAHLAALAPLAPGRKIHGLYFGFPGKSAQRDPLNEWLRREVEAHATPLSRALRLVAPSDDRAQVAASLRSGEFCGIKVYHVYANRPDTMNAELEEYAPEWMWEILNETRGLLMLHLVRDDALADPVNQRSLRRLCRAYPRVRVVLAHIARSFNYRHARASLRSVADLDNVILDTSAICEAEAFRAALEILGPKRVLWGTDYPVSELRGRAIATGRRFFWLQPESLRPEAGGALKPEMTLIGIESLLTLREACEDAGMTSGDVEDIFLRNALRELAPHLPATAVPPAPDGPALWQRAREVISGGTGLLSKRAEMFDAKTWPAYFSRCSGCSVWDLQGRRYVDFAGAVGAIVLGYSDPDVNAAVHRRVSLGSYCTLVSPQEVELAETLLALHPWAGKVRYARGGGEAMMMSVRIARAATGRSGVVFCGYHGWHDWYLAANLGDTDALTGHLLPGLEPKGVPRELRGTAATFRYNDLASLDAALAKIGGNLAAVVMEPMRSQMPRDNFLQQAAARCRAAGAVFIIDEVTSGLRYGFPGAMARFGVDPDLSVYAKAVSNGFPFGAIVGRRDVMDAAGDSFVSSSYWTDGVGTAAALAVLEKARRLDVQPIIWKSGEALQSSLRELAAQHPRCRLTVGGMPPSPTLAFDLGADSAATKTLFMRKMRERGFLLSGQLYVMHAHEPEHISSMLAAAAESLGEVSRALETGRLTEEAGASHAQQGFARLA